MAQLKGKHILKKLKKGLSKLRIIFFDVETEPTKETDDKIFQGFRLCTANLCEYSAKGDFRIIERRTFYDQKSFHQWFLSKMYKKHILYCLSANIWFDLHNSDLFMFFMRLYYDPKIFHSDGLCTIIKLAGNQGTVIFLNMQQLIPVSVEVYGEMVGLAKLKIDLATEDLKELAIYCQRDTDIITEVFKQWLDFALEHNLGRFCFTLASQSFTAFRHRFMKDEIFIHNNQYITRFERMSYTGGRTECFTMGMIHEKTIYELDINSMYPHIMRNQYMPVKWISTHRQPPNIALHYWLCRYCCIAYVAIETDEPAYPVKIDGKLCFPTGRFHTYLAHPELEYAFYNNHLKSIHYLVLYEKKIIFRDYVDFFYRLKLQYEAEGNEAYRFMTKRMMNSLYGKFGQKVDVFYFEDKVDTPAYKCETVYDGEPAISYRELILGHKRMVYQEKAGDANECLVAIPSVITSASRLLLWKLIKRAGRKNVFYCDTDSMFVNREGLERLGDEVDPKELGKLGLKGRSSFMYIFGPKDYRFGTKTRIKGVGRKATPNKSGRYEQLQFPSVRGCLQSGLQEQYFIRKIAKKLNRIYTKGTINNDGSITPFDLNILEP